ncbi:MAG: 50S ribosomal protein L22 [Rhodospirillales bacterium]|nr:50S ribosomal protein L22 [Rhodospirillales bacterium]
MGKKNLERQLPDNEVRAMARSLRTSSRKLNLVAEQIRGKPVARALAELTFSKRRIAVDVKKVLQSAIANAENNHGLDVDRLVVARASVGQSIKMRRFRPAGRGRLHPYRREFSNIEIIVREVAESEY